MNMDIEAQKRAAGEAAIEFVEDNMFVGVGTGNWSAGVDYSLEAGNRQLNQSGRAGVMMEF